MNILNINDKFMCIAQNRASDMIKIFEFLEHLCIGNSDFPEKIGPCRELRPPAGGHASRVIVYGL